MHVLRAEKEGSLGCASPTCNADPAQSIVDGCKQERLLDHVLPNYLRDLYSGCFTDKLYTSKTIY